MESKDKKPPFPQANDFNKVVSILNIENEETLQSDRLLGAYLDGIAERQSRYYVSAAQYVEFLDQERHFTNFARRIRAYNDSSQRVFILQKLLGDTVIGRIYVSEKLYDIKYQKSDVIDIIKEQYPAYTDLILARRAQCALAWVNWVKKQLNEIE